MKKVTISSKPSRKNQWEEIYFSIGESALGLVLVALSEKGLCAVLIGSDRDALIEDLEERFCAHLISDTSKTEKILQDVLNFIKKPSSKVKTPLDIRGTAFQQKVWDAVCKIPLGSTLTYTDVAIQLNSPNGCRAVAKACSSNTHAIIIPCHRVIKKNGDFCGYKWGLERKKELLQLESAASLNVEELL